MTSRPANECGPRRAHRAVNCAAMRGAAMRGAAIAAVIVSAATAAGCPRRPTASQCTYTSECAEGLACVASQCRAQCLSDRDCPAGMRCGRTADEDLSRRACLPVETAAQCAHNTDCPVPALCARDHVCRVPCRVASDCPRATDPAECRLPEGVCATPVTVGELPAPDANGGDAAIDASTDVTPADVRGDVAVDVTEGGAGACDPGAVRDLSGLSPSADGWIHVSSSSVTSSPVAVVQHPPQCVSEVLATVHQVAFTYRPTSESFIAASLVSAGTPTNFDANLMFTDGCAAGARVLACNDDSTVADLRPVLLLGPLVAAGGTATVLVASYDRVPAGVSNRSNFELLVRTLRPVADGSPCDATGATTRCRTGACAPVGAPGTRCTPLVLETEPNNDRVTAALVTGRQASVEGTLMGTDVDCFGLRAGAGDSLVAYTHDGNGACPVGLYGTADTALAVYDSTGAMVAANDDAPGHGTCSRIDGAVAGAGFALPRAGDYRLCVATSGRSDVARYVVSMALVP